MATQPIPQIGPNKNVPLMNWDIAVVQIGDQIMLKVLITDIAGVSIQIFLNQDSARAVSKAIKEGVEKAEVTIVKPQSALAPN